MDAQMKKGILEMCILFQLRDRRLYGYEIMKLIRQHFPDVYEGSVYTILRRLNATGCTEITLQPSANGPDRKYYDITAAGRDYLAGMLEEWQHTVHSARSLGIPCE